MENIFFSIAIPAYKGKFLKECIESILAQSYTFFEIIIVNDASPENLDAIVKKFTDQRIKYYKNNQNCGAINVVENWNKCLAYSSGDFIICMGDDDKLLPNCLQTYVNLINKYPNLEIYHGWSEIIDEESQYKDIQEPRPEWESTYSLIWNRWTNRKKQYIGDFLFKTQSLKKAGGFYKLPLAWSSDDITATLISYPLGIANTQEIIFQYRENRLTISSSSNYDLKLEAILLEKEWYKNFLKSTPTNVTDIKYWTSLNHIFNKYFEEKIHDTIIESFKSHSIFYMYHWWKFKRSKVINNKLFLKILSTAINIRSKKILRID